MSPTASPPPAPPLLECRRFGVAFGRRVILADVTLTIPARGVTVLMGPAGGGKSTLLRTVCGLNDASPAIRTWGRVEFDGDPMADGNRPLLVEQKAAVVGGPVIRALAEALPDRHLLTPAQQRDRIGETLQTFGLGHLDLDVNVLELSIPQKRQVLILRHLFQRPRLLCVDEPTAGLSDTDAEPVLELLEQVASLRPLLVVTHHQAHARRLGGLTVLLAGGRVIESAPTEQFFSSPQQDLTMAFVRSGSCSVPSPDADPDTLDPSVQTSPLPAEAMVAIAGRIRTTPPADGDATADSASVDGTDESSAEDPGAPVQADADAHTTRTAPSSQRTRRRQLPSGFHWLFENRFAGSPMPGLLNDTRDDLAAMRDAGVTLLVSLTEAPFPASALEEFGIKGHHVPVVDMDVPTISEAVTLAEKIERWLADGEVVVAHCRAGLGRTGTVLTCQLIWRGESPVAALRRVRTRQRLYVQSERQRQFLDEFAEFIGHRPAVPG